MCNNGANGTQTNGLNETFMGGIKERSRMIEMTP